jgi:hypothetical protein
VSPWTTVDRAPTRLPSKILFQWIKSKINWYTNILGVIWISRFRSIERDSPMWCKSLVPHISQHVSLAALKSPGSLNFIHFNSLILLTLATDSNDAIWPAPQRSCANTLCEIYRKSANGTVNRRWWVVWWIDWRKILLAQNWMKHFGRRGNFRSRTNSSIALFENNNSPDAGIILLFFFSNDPQVRNVCDHQSEISRHQESKRKAIQITNAAANGVIIITITTYQQTIYIQYIST